MCACVFVMSVYLLYISEPQQIRLWLAFYYTDYMLLSYIGQKRRRVCYLVESYFVQPCLYT